MSSSWSSNIARKGSSSGPRAWYRPLLGFRLEGSLLLFVLALNVVFLLGYLGPLYQETVSQRVSLQAARDRVSQLLEYLKAQEDLDEVEKTFIPQQEMAKLANLLPELAGRHRLTLPEVNYQTEGNRLDEMKRLSLNFKLIGPYKDIREFIHEAENLEWFLYIEDMSLSGSSKNSRNLTMDIHMLTHLR